MQWQGVKQSQIKTYKYKMIIINHHDMIGIITYLEDLMQKLNKYLIVFVLILIIFLCGCTDKTATDIREIDENDSHYDVVVIGGEPEGVAAAVSAARNGAKTILIEKRADLGGLFT